MRFRFSLALASTLVLALALPGRLMATSEQAGAGDRSGVQQIGLLTGFGSSNRGNVQIVPLALQAAWLLPDVIDRPLARHGLNLKWLVEGYAAGVTDHSNAVEFGVSPIIFKLDYDRGQRIVPFVDGGTGVLYTSLQGLRLGGPFEFGSFIGAGLHLLLTDRLALSLSYRLRHISNAGLKSDNSGLNTDFFLLGLDYFPRR